MQEINKLTIGNSQYEIADAAARASLEDKADKSEVYTKSDIDDKLGDLDTVLEVLGV